MLFALLHFSWGKFQSLPLFRPCVPASALRLSLVLSHSFSVARSPSVCVSHSPFVSPFPSYSFSFYLPLFLYLSLSYRLLSHTHRESLSLSHLSLPLPPTSSFPLSASLSPGCLYQSLKALSVPCCSTPVTLSLSISVRLSLFALSHLSSLFCLLFSGSLPCLFALRLSACPSACLSVCLPDCSQSVLALFCLKFIFFPFPPFDLLFTSKKIGRHVACAIAQFLRWNPIST